MKLYFTLLLKTNIIRLSDVLMSTANLFQMLLPSCLRDEMPYVVELSLGIIVWEGPQRLYGVLFTSNCC